ncbi:MAG: type VI secretion system tip protein TssI/VgrG [Variovorax sp.]
MADTTFQIRSDSPVNDDLMFWRIVGHEVLSRPAFYELTVLSRNNAIAPKDILGRAFDVVIEFSDADGGTHQRHAQGHAVRFTREQQVGRFFQYTLQLRSWFWLLTKRSNSRILQEQPVLEVMNAVFEDSPISRFKKTNADHVTGSHAAHRYCVQYQESDYSFLSRMMEEEGIYYWFDAHDAPGMMHLSDASDIAHDKLPVSDTLRFLPNTAGEARFNEVTSWVSTHSFDSGKFASLDNDFKVIGKKLSADKADPDMHELADLEAFEFPGGYFEGHDTDSIARMRLDEIVGRRHRHWALTSWPDVAAGKSFTFEGDPDGTLNGDYVIAACTFMVSHPGYEGLGLVEAERSVVSVLQEALRDDPVNADARMVLEDLIDRTPTLRIGPRGVSAFLLTVMPSDVPWRPPRLTARKTMPGPQSAIVVGKAGEEIWTDKYGRVKVQFHWDRYGKSDENSSCWIRVSHPWAGKGWGSVSIPRIGQEVIVDFLEGDPDRPIIIGRVYNGESMPPYSLPGNAVVSGLKTNTHKGKGYNEMSMNDTAGKELINIHAQYDMTTKVEHDDKQTVVNNRTINVDGTHTETIKGDTTIKVTVGKLVHDVLAGTADYHVQGALDEKYDATQTTKIKGNLTIASTGGAISVSSDSQHIYIHAATSIQLHTGASKLWMAADGNISLEGVNVTISGSGGVFIKGGVVHSEAESEHQTKGAIVLSEGSATNTVRGGMVMLNP